MIHWSTPAGVPVNTIMADQNKKPEKPHLEPEYEKKEIYLPRVTAMEEVPDLPDSFYELNKEDISHLSVKKEDDLLKTKTYQQSQRIKKLQQYKKTTMKIKLPDGIEICINYHPMQYVSDMYNDITELLRDKEWKFVLRSSVGRRQPLDNNDKTFAEMGLVPGAIVILNFIKDEHYTVAKPFLNEEAMKNAIQK